MTDAQIIEAIRAEVEKRKVSDFGRFEILNSGPGHSPSSLSVHEVLPQLEYAFNELERARLNSHPKARGFLKIFRFIIRIKKQRRVNQALMNSLEASLQASQRLISLLQSKQQIELHLQSRRDAWQETADLSITQWDEYSKKLAQQESAKKDPHQHDAFYLAFENKFRGSSEIIRSRLSVYLPYLETAWERIAKSNPNLSREKFRGIDLGCGRGEWLDLIRDQGFLAGRGYDLNHSMIELCEQKHLTVSVGDGIERLRALPDQSVGFITGFHITEHLSFDTLMELLAETLRVLMPMGIAIFETPNPETLRVGSFTFHYDPTHQKPIPPAVLELMAEQTGFPAIEILRLHPYRDFDPAAELPDFEELNHTLNGPLDYAVILTQGPISVP